MRVPPSRPQLNLVTYQGFHIQIPLPWGLEFQHVNGGVEGKGWRSGGGGDTNIQSITVSNWRMCI